MKLYHVSLDVGNIKKEFVPQIPESRMFGEDSEIPRICLSSSVSGCCSATIWGGSSFEDLFWECGQHVPIRVYEFDTNDIIAENLITPDYLYKTDKVRDAEINNEYWVINQTLKPIRTYLINVIDYEETLADDITYEDKKYCMDNDVSSEIWESYTNGVFTVLDLEYEILKEGSNEIKDIIYTDELTVKLDVDNVKFDLIEANLELKKIFLDLFVPDVTWKKEKEDFLKEYKFNMNSKGIIKVKLGDKYGFVLSQVKSVLLEELINLK